MVETDGGAVQGKPTGRGWLSALGVYFTRRSLVMLALGFAAGLPNLLIFDTLSAWLRESGLSLQVIGFFSLATISYSLKFLWAPLIDRTAIPGLTGLFGHRRSWMLAAQGAIIVGLWLIAGSNPAENLALVAVFAVITGFASATQDIVIDAWRIEAAPTEDQGAMAAAYQWGYRIAIIVAGAVPLVLAERFGWSLSYSAMAALMGVGVLAVILAPREKAHTVRAIPIDGITRRPAIEAVEWLVRLAIFLAAALFLGSGLGANATMLATVSAPVLGADGAEALKAAWTAKPDGVWWQLGGIGLGFALLAASAAPIPGVRTLPGHYLGVTLGSPLADFLSRYGRAALFILALICLYRVSDFVLNIMNPFYLDLGYTKDEIAEVRKVFGVFASLGGVFAAGLAIARFGIMGPLIVGAAAGPMSNLVFAWLATQNADLTALFIAIGIDNVASGYAGTCLIAYMSSLTSIGFTATQYALFSSLYSILGKIIASQSGRIVEGAARSAESGGFAAPLTAYFTSLSETAYSAGAASAGVSPAALGAGYIVFFFYSFAIGLAAVVLVLIVAWQTKSLKIKQG